MRISHTSNQNVRMIQATSFPRPMNVCQLSRSQEAQKHSILRRENLAYTLTALDWKAEVARGTMLGMGHNERRMAF